jgi:hypothetical protein
MEHLLEVLIMEIAFVWRIGALMTETLMEIIKKILLVELLLLKLLSSFLLASCFTFALAVIPCALGRGFMFCNTYKLVLVFRLNASIRRRSLPVCVRTWCIFVI